MMAETPEGAAPPRIEPWMRGFLLLATGYNLLWGTLISQWPTAFYHWVRHATERGTALPAPPIVTYQGYGVLLLALLYLVSALYPARYWYLVALGALSKLAGAAAFWLLVMEQTATKRFYFHLIFNDLVWVPVLIAIALRGYRVQRRPRPEGEG